MNVRKCSLDLYPGRNLTPLPSPIRAHVCNSRCAGGIGVRRVNARSRPRKQTEQYEPIAARRRRGRRDYLYGRKGEFGWLGRRVVSVQDTGAEGPEIQIVVATLSGNSLRQTVHTHCASVHQAAKLVTAQGCGDNCRPGGK